MTRVSSILFWFGLPLIVSLALYGTSNRVQNLNTQLHALNAQIEAEQANIHVLKAEWVYLSNPERIEAAARKYLSMHPTAIKQIAKLNDLPEILPTTKEAQQNRGPRTKAVANTQQNVEPTKPPVKATSAARLVPVTNAAPKITTPMETAFINTHMHMPSEQIHEATAPENLPLEDENSIVMAESVPPSVSGTAP